MHKATIKEEKGIISAEFSADGNHIITADTNKMVRIYGWISDGQLQKKAVIKHNINNLSARFTKDCSHVVVRHDNNSITISRLFWDGTTKNCTEE
ncbi:MAG: hypothetical protein QS748_03720 [Candidatus Endonucleobacter bathymodioli]|uniref:WD domain, G-beta repeat n=1 Tax=Candidatus Endonucleibacter bathymodioli TaxID=539814 RepID=A0AA90NX86_9GAMM|nr:hypothetical protein [Candidatus Endonucleobacter bathymodioli]